MKRIISLFAVTSMLFALSTSALAATTPAYSVKESTGVSVENMTVTYDSATANGFEFRLEAPAEDLHMITAAVDVKNLVDNGWKIEGIVGDRGKIFYTECEYVSGSAYATSGANPYQVYVDQAWDADYPWTEASEAGKGILYFKATPDTSNPNLKINDVTFTIVTADYTLKDGTKKYSLDGARPTFTIKDAGSDAKVGTEELTQNAEDKIGSSNTITYMGTSSEAYIVENSYVEVTCTVNSEDEDIKKEYNITRKFDKLLDALFGGVVEGKGKFTADKVNFAVIYDKEFFNIGTVAEPEYLTPTFTFEIFGTQAVTE